MKSEPIRRIARIRNRTIFVTTAALLGVATGTAAILLILISGLFLSAWLLMLILFPVLFLGWRWLRRADIRSIGYQLEQHFPELRNRLVAAIELARYQPGAENYSLELRDAAVEQIRVQTAHLNLESVVPVYRWKWSAIFALAGVSLFVFYIFTFSAPARFGLINAFAPAGNRIRLQVTPGDTTVTPNTAITIGCAVEPAGIFRTITLELMQPDAPVQRLHLKLVSDRCTLPVTVRSRINYRFRLLGKTCGWYTIRTPEPVVLKNVIFTGYPPEYTGLPPVRLTGPELTLLAGTQVELTGIASAPIRRARLLIGAETLPVLMNPAEPQQICARFTVLEDAAGILELATMSEPFQPALQFHIRKLSDEPPLVNIFLPGRDIDLPLKMQVPLGINSLDDFGLTAIWLHYGKDTLNRKLLLKRPQGAREDTVLYLWDLSGISLLPGEVLHYYVRAVDNDLVSGPKSGTSAIFTIRFPTMTEIYSQAVEQTSATINELEPLQTEQAKLGAELTRLTEDLKRRRELSWEEKKQLDRIAREQNALLSEIDRLQEEIARTSTDLLEGMSWDPETLERLTQLQELLSRLIPENLQQALRELSRKLQQEPGSLRPVLEQLQSEQQRLKTGIERALELLRRMTEEIKLEALARQAEELARRQDQLTRNLPAQPAESLGRNQEQISAGIDSMINGLEELSRNFSEPAVAESLHRLNEQLAQKNLSGLARSLARQLNAGAKADAAKKSEQLNRSLKELAEELNRLSSSLKKSRSEAITRQIFTYTTGLLTISAEQERLEQALQHGISPNEIAPAEQALLEAVKIAAESIAGLTGQTLSVPPTVSQELARALNSMRTAGEQAAGGTSYGLAASMRQARQSLNRAIAQLLQAGSAARQGGGLAGGLQNLLEQLSRMTAEQLAINAGMSGLPIPIPAAGLSPQQQEQLMQLLSRQQALRQQLEDLLGSLGGEKPGLTGMLEGLVEEMKGIERSLAELQVDRRLIERQQGIVTRLLDVQRSLRQQGFREEREAQRAQPYQPADAARLPEDLGERNRRLRQELLRALKQGFPAEYEPLIRSYFEMLLQEAP
ncbi:MAG: DUF4175 family protein [candidate division WOR-3 bacterium]